MEFNPSCLVPRSMLLTLHWKSPSSCQVHTRTQKLCEIFPQRSQLPGHKVFILLYIAELHVMSGSGLKSKHKTNAVELKLFSKIIWKVPASTLSKSNTVSSVFVWMEDCFLQLNMKGLGLHLGSFLYKNGYFMKNYI